MTDNIASGTTTKRVRLQRIPGYRKPPGAVVVTRVSKHWGNPYPEKNGAGPRRSSYTASTCATHPNW